MSDFSPLNILKSQSKQLARDQGLKLSVAQETLVQKAGFADYHEFSVVAQRNPKDPRLMMTVFGVRDFSDAIHEDDVYADLDQELEDQLSGAIAETNASGFTVDNLTVDASEYTDSTGMLILGVSLTYQGKQVQERVYHGAAFFLTATVELLRREGKWLLAEDGVSIISGESDADRDRRSELQYWAAVEEARSSNRMSMAQALASELGISVEDGELLAGSEITTNESDDGLPYSHRINFEPEAEGELRADLLARFGSLEHELNANFFDDVEREF
ncbi:hypothetical protein LT706_17480 [Pseudomonas syringae pv. syringae]|uniref:hypothetical protein n=1 Tax=Pseudomonas TaxID=286 RepID=UPI0006B9110D|nr:MULTISPECIES: hypothetical protein [Pseudomonas]MCK9703164.1 hypothetical protein [Pseudomonas syringae pv. syringae]MCK9713306.1 hypothetical protein [Pseudomonas syringae pv. syringae]MCK9758538.1 hypothetical protein [Pseudomonas syringae pv. syringae]MCK9772899.1 hypothetical protein [Pseudomonas syringae pv. syringae]MDA7013685.1 hypothetical protein [Pseudomonas cerasi]